MGLIIIIIIFNWETHILIILKKPYDTTGTLIIAAGSPE